MTSDYSIFIPPDPNRPEERELWNRFLLHELSHNEPPLCECARFGKRSLSWAPWIGGLSERVGTVLDKKNLELSHEHLVFEGSGDNVGFGLKGLFQEDISKAPYHYFGECLNGTVMRRALEKIREVGKYNFFRNNCQDFTQKVRDAYRELIGK